MRTTRSGSARPNPCSGPQFSSVGDEPGDSNRRNTLEQPAAIRKTLPQTPKDETYSLEQALLHFFFSDANELYLNAIGFFRQRHDADVVTLFINEGHVCTRAYVIAMGSRSVFFMLVARAEVLLVPLGNLIETVGSHILFSGDGETSSTRR